MLMNVYFFFSSNIIEYKNLEFNIQNQYIYVREPQIYIYIYTYTVDLLKSAKIKI